MINHVSCEMKAHKHTKTENLKEYWLKHINLLGQQSYCSYMAKLGPFVFIFQTDVRFDTEHTENTKAGNRVSNSERSRAYRHEKRGVKLK